MQSLCVFLPKCELIAEHGNTFLRFALFNGFGAVLWSCLVGGAGWAFGQAAEAVLGQIHSIEGWLFLGLVAVGAGVWLFHKLRR